MQQQILITLATLAMLAVIAIAVVMVLRYRRDWLKRRHARTQFKLATAHSREHYMIDILQRQMGELWDVPREERPVVAIIAKTRKGDGVMMFGHPDGITDRDKDYSQGKCREVLEAIAINMGRVETHQDKSNCVNTLLGLLEHQMVVINDKRKEEEQIKNLLT